MTMSRRKQRLVMATMNMIITVLLMARPVVISDAKIINITNKISNKKVLIVQCESVDGDLGALAVNSGYVYSWDFENNSHSQPVVFWCHLALEDGRLSFVAYIEGATGYAVMGYDVNETGLYGPDMYDWSRKYDLLRGWKRIQLP